MTQSVLKASIFSGKFKWLFSVTIFAFCVGPTFISYQPYQFRWDDTDYMERAVAVSRAFWSWNVHGIGAAMISLRPPAMTFMGLPWGPLTSWEAAGNCFITLAAAISLLAALCLYLLLRIGVKPTFLAAASVCAVASVGPYPAGAPLHAVATGFYADSLFAWTTFAALLLIPYQARTYDTSIKGAVARGILWGVILSLGALTKLDFPYFILLIVPTLFVLTLRRGGVRVAVASLIACACVSAPAVFYFLRWGRLAFLNARASSFGSLAGFYYIPLSQFLGDTFRRSPGLLLSLALTISALTYLVIKRRTALWGPDFLAFLVLIGFGIVALASSNREIRLLLPAIVALPFLAGILMSGKGIPVPRRLAAVIAGLVCCCLTVAAVPTRYRASRESLSKCDAVLTEATRCNARRILMATDSPTFNKNLMDLATEFSTAGSPADTGTLSYRAVFDFPIEEDFETISESDEVVFQEEGERSPLFTNQRDSDYERYLQQHGFTPIRVGSDLIVYSARCRP